MGQWEAVLVQSVLAVATEWPVQLQLAWDDRVAL